MKIKNQIYIYDSEATLPKDPEHKFYQVERIMFNTKFRFVVSHDGDNFYVCNRIFTFENGDKYKEWEM